MGKDLERRADLVRQDGVARRDGLDRPELPSEFREAVLQCIRILADALPPGVELHLTAQDEADHFFSERSNDSVVIPGRLSFDVEVAGSRGRLVAGWPMINELRVLARAVWNSEGEVDLVVTHAERMTSLG